MFSLLWALKQNILGKISNYMLRCNNLRWELTSVHRHNIGRRHSTENALEINLNFIRKRILNTKV